MLDADSSCSKKVKAVFVGKNATTSLARWLLSISVVVFCRIWKFFEACKCVLLTLFRNKPRVYRSCQKEEQRFLLQSSTDLLNWAWGFSRCVWEQCPCGGPVTAPQPVSIQCMSTVSYRSKICSLQAWLLCWELSYWRMGWNSNFTEQDWRPGLILGTWRAVAIQPDQKSCAESAQRTVQTPITNDGLTWKTQIKQKWQIFYFVCCFALISGKNPGRFPSSQQWYSLSGEGFVHAMG